MTHTMRGEFVWMTAWPKMMARKTALAYLDVGDAAFEREIAAYRILRFLGHGSKAEVAS